MIENEIKPQLAPPANRRSLWPVLLLVLVLFLSAAGITWLFTSEPAIDPVASATTTLITTPEPVDQPVVLGSEEPIADAAEIILPSVVQISVNGGVGSGVIYDANGLILTAAHVVDNAETVEVRLSDGEELTGEVLGSADSADVAVIKVERTGLPAASLALDELPRVGQMAIAVGSPWGLQGTVTAGIISAVNQSLNGQFGPRAMLQTDAAINPGNSGGALVDRLGRLLGINVSIFSASGANDGVGFAVPIDVAYDIADRLVSGTSLEFAYLGVSGGDVDPGSGRAGALITEVVPGTAAEIAGIQVGDLVVAIEDVRVLGILDLAAQVRSHRPGSEVQLVIVRDGAEQTITAVLGEGPPASE